MKTPEGFFLHETYGNTASRGEEVSKNLMILRRKEGEGYFKKPSGFVLGRSLAFLAFSCGKRGHTIETEGRSKSFDKWESLLEDVQGV